MILTRTRRFLVAMRPYESYGFEASVTVSHSDLGWTNEQVAEMDESSFENLRTDLQELAEEILDAQLRDEIASAQRMTQDPESFILMPKEP